MFFYLATLLAFILFQNCNAVRCADRELTLIGETTRKKTCEGSVCMNLLNKHQSDKTCITTGPFNITKGCAQHDQFDDNTIACFCDTDLCNAKDKRDTGTPVVVMKPFVCITFDGFETGRKQAPVCSMTVKNQGAKRTVIKSAESSIAEAYAIPATREASLDSFTYLVGIVHTTSGWPMNTTMHHYKCYGDNCNEKIKEDFPVKTDVQCNTTGAESCYGEFCVLATNGTTLKYCLSTQSVTNKQQYEKGIFKYKTSTFYLCKENFCNSDKETAITSILKAPEEPTTTEIPTTTTEEPMPVGANILTSGGYGIQSLLKIVFLVFSAVL